LLSLFVLRNDRSGEGDPHVVNVFAGVAILALGGLDIHAKFLVETLEVGGVLLENTLEEVAFGLALGAEVDSEANDGQRQCLDGVLALHEFELAA